MMENRPGLTLCMLRYQFVLEFVWTWLAVNKIGGTTAFVNYRLHGTSLRHVLQVANAKAFIVGKHSIDASD
jgi:acyl-CoA synthetase (AMP-forming)/AMP-acid ligase II